jgi:adenylate cyclase 5
MFIELLLPERNRIGMNDMNEVKSAEEEVNEYLLKAIDARSIDRLRLDHCKKYNLTFKKDEIERKYCNEPDPMLKIYFYCSGLCFVGIATIEILAFNL